MHFPLVYCNKKLRFPLFLPLRIKMRESLNRNSSRRLRAKYTPCTNLTVDARGISLSIISIDSLAIIVYNTNTITWIGAQNNDQKRYHRLTE